MLVAQTGCNALCSGPGCEDFYPSAVLSVLPGVAQDRTLDVWEDALGLYDGADIEGSDWVTAAVPGGMLIGQPRWEQDGVAVGRVVLVGVPDGLRPVIPLAEWVNDEGGVSGFGSSIHAELDPDGIGFDLWVGAPDHDQGRGAVYLFRDAESGGRPASARDLVLLSATPNDGFGTRLLSCADLTDDGRPELVVTAPWFVEPTTWSVPVEEPIPSLAGAVFVVRSEDVDEETGAFPPWDVGRVWWGDTVGEGAGTAVVCDRDLDGDDLVDVVIGSPWSQEARGHVTILSGFPLPPSGPLSAAADRILLGPETEDWFGGSLATLRGKQRVMLAVGGAGYDLGAGQVHLYEGTALTAAEPARFASFESDPERQLPDHFGRWLSAGDLDGDGLTDLVVGAPDYKGDARNAFDTGRLWVFYGSGTGDWETGRSALTAELAVGGARPFTRIGRMVTLADGDGDGADELWVPTRSEASER